MNDPCETYRTSISALIDGELETPERLPAVDHLLECAACRIFYRRARALGDMLVASQSQDAEPAPEDVWERIAAASGVTGQRRTRWRELRRAPRWAAQLAAALIVGLALGWLLPRLPAPALPEQAAAGEVDVVLEEDKGSMTDERFVELATEILRADRDYHRKMLEVMAVVTAVGRTEGSVDEKQIYGEGARRISLGESGGEDSIVLSGDRL
ncbi:MAG TPA: zf-HC2 domain-containing protein [Thermoanaerobaculia bacterium]